MITLGCLKNQADAEALLRRAASAGIGYTDDTREADVLLVNTCGFIEDAKRESIDEILELSGQKRPGQRLVVMGCLSGRYGQTLKAEMPEIDALFGVGQDELVVREILGHEPAPVREAPPAAPLLARSPAAPLKVAEGCDRACRFCVIPSIRGPYRSRPRADVLREAEEMLGAGVRELLLVAQDLTSYGRDTGDTRGLPGLVRDLASFGGEYWVRLLYLHPAHVDAALLDAMAAHAGVVAPYVDMPVQHSVTRVLRSMGRPGTRRELVRLVRQVREALPGAAVRTTVLVGFPGETEEEFRGLLSFINEARFDRLGAFAYSREEGTPAALRSEQVHHSTRERRKREVIEAQARISLEANQRLVGQTFIALVESIEGDTAIVRLATQAPEVDGETLVRDASLRPGEFVQVRVTGADVYDLTAEAL